MKQKDYILSLIEEGEHEHQDFKYQISDARKIARSISAFANNDGGHLLVGVKDNGHIAGVSSDEEIYMIDQAAQMYCRPEQKVSYKLYRVADKQVLKVDIAPADDKPVLAQDDNGKWRTYYRVADENVLASNVHVKVMQHRKDDAQPFSFTEREKQLIDYLGNHGAITIDGYMRLAHCSRDLAENSVVEMCDIGVVELYYHDGQCLVTLAKNDDE